MAAGRHRAPDSPDDYTTSRGEARRAPKAGEKTRRAPSYKRVPVEIIDAPRNLREHDRRRAARAGGGGTRKVTVRHAGPSKGERRSARADRLADEASRYANRQALKATTGKPSVTGRAVGGAAAGAAAGTALGGPVGTAVGGAIGGVAGGASGLKAKRDYKSAMRAEPGLRRVIVAEFAVCIVVAALSPMTDEKRTEAPQVFMKRMTAIMALFFVLGIVSAAGRGPAKVAAGFGGIVTVALLVSERNLFVKLARVFNSRGGAPETGTGSIDHSGEMQAAE